MTIDIGIALIVVIGLITVGEILDGVLKRRHKRIMKEKDHKKWLDEQTLIDED